MRDPSESGFNFVQTAAEFEQELAQLIQGTQPTIAQTLQRLGCAPVVAGDYASATAEVLAKGMPGDWALALLESFRQANQGATVYIPHVNVLEREAKKAALKAAYNGHNLKALCRQHNIPERTAYRWLMTEK